MNFSRPFPRSIFLIALSFFLLAAASCARPTAEGKRYDLKGKVISVDRAKGEVKIQHEDVKGYMPAMTMDFPLHDEDALKTVEAGDDKKATLVVTGGAYWI